MSVSLEGAKPDSSVQGIRASSALRFIARAFDDKTTRMPTPNNEAVGRLVSECAAQWSAEVDRGT